MSDVPKTISSQDETYSPVPLAIVGIGCMFPKADDLDQYWSNIRRGVDAIDEVPADSHWDPKDYFDDDKSAPDMTYANRGGFINPIDFDPLFYGISPNNIEATDTTQLLGMVATHRALRDANYETGSNVGDGRPFDRNRCSAIVGVTGTLELVIPLGARLGHPLWRKALREAGVDEQTTQDVVERIAEGYVPWQENSFPGLLGNVAAGRIANRFDLGGTNCVVDAACASSLSAVHMAAMELYTGRADMAITGGLDTFNDIFMYMCFSKTPALSPTGNSKPFSANGDGTILGEGLGICILKRLADAKRDNDKIYAVIKSIGSSSDGRGNAIYAPSDKGQTKALRNAYRTAGVKPSSIELVEAHGTGTKVGDGVEIKALSEVYREDKSEGTWCAIGSVKSMIGHTKAAAGAAGLIKAAMALHHRTLPPTIKVDNPLDAVQPNAAPVYVNSDAKPWLAREAHPRRAALSAFGFGGSNFHCVLEETDPAEQTIDWDSSILLFAVCGETNDVIQTQLADIDPESDWAILRSQAKQLRDALKHDAKCRLTFVVQRDETDLKALLEKLSAQLQAGSETWSLPNAFYSSQTSQGQVAVLFPGQGSQRVGMLRDLACQMPQLQQALQQADAAFGKPEHGERLSDHVYPISVFDDEAKQQQEAALRQTQIAQPAIGATSAGAWQLLLTFGLSADAFVGHSFGELTALWAAGAYDEQTLYNLAIARGSLMAEAAGDAAGSMLAVFASADDVQKIIDEKSLDIVIANFNAPKQVILSGSKDAVAAAEQAMTQAGHRAKALPVSAAFHSKLVADAAKPFGERLADVTFSETKQPVYANTTASPYPTDAAAARDLLANQLANSVQFSQTVRNLFDAGVRTFIEVGPGATLAGLASSTLEGEAVHVIALDQSRGKKPGQLDLALLLAQLASLGHEINLTPYDADAPHVEKPTKKSMTVKLTGANHRSPYTPKPPAPPAPPKPEHQVRAGAQDQNAQPPKTVSDTVSKTPPAPTSPDKAFAVNQNQPMQDPSTNPHLSQALQATQQSILALQQMQQQTAQLHRQYLQGQEAAHQTIQQLIAQQQSLLGQAAGQPIALPTPPAPPASPVPTATQTPVQPIASQPQSTPAPTIASVTQSAPTQPQAAQPAPTAAPLNTNRFTDALLKVVAEKTGYPAEMLELDMSLDADLGIDSIKRVEILSALQTELPDAPPVQPEDLGALQTLRQIVDFMAAAEAETVSDTVSGTTAPAQTSTGLSAAIFTDALLKVVAEKTGYPAEMLELDMSLDADLGIDSIKRVEILSALQTELPDAPPVQPEDLGALQTLRQIVDFMAAAEAETVSDTVSGTAAPTAQKPEHQVFAGVQDTGALNAAVFTEALLKVVAEKTGYPAEMLELDMSLDADLGIDSIKRVEILSALQTELPDAPPVQPEDLGALQTLRQIVDFMAAADAETVSDTVSGPEAEPVSDTVSGTDAPTAQKPEHQVFAGVQDQVDQSAPTSAQPHQALLERHIPALTELSADSEYPALRPTPGGVVWIAGDDSELTTAITSAIQARKLTPYLIDVSERPKTNKPLAGLLIIAPINADENHTRNAFGLLQHAGSALAESAKKADAFFATASRLGGRFGLDDKTPRNALTGALAGLSKTASHEWQTVHCKAIDLPAVAGDVNLIASQVAEQLLTAGPLEVGISDDSIVTVSLTDQPLDDKTLGEPPLGKDDLVLVSGGARGVTATVAIAFAKRFGCKLVLLGRSPEPTAEPDWLTGLTDEPAIKQAILQHQSNGSPLTPKQVQAEYDQIKAAREIAHTMSQIKTACGLALYKQVDVRNRSAVNKAVNELRQTHGPIRGIIHGAGVLADKLIEDKTDEQFDRVFGTKVEGFESLLAATADDDLRTIVAFSSSTGRFGRRGQIDYAAANEALNKLSQQQARLRPDCRVLSINWGPWDGGMVTPQLKQVFAAEGVGVIDLQAGGDYLVDEVCTPVGGPVEIVIVGKLPQATGSTSSSTPTPAVPAAPAPPIDVDMSTYSNALSLELSVESMPVLKSHVLDGKAVVPMAVIIEWLAHGAMHDNPGLRFVGFDDLQLFKGITIDAVSSLPISVLAAPAQLNGDLDIVPVLLKAGDTLCAKANILLAMTTAAAGSSNIPTIQGSYDGNAKNAYADGRLFHGKQLQLISEVLASGNAGIAVNCMPTPAPAEWMAKPLRSSWLADPGAIDCAFQAAILWSQQHRGSPNLPSNAKGYRQFTDRFPADGCKAYLQVTSASDNSATFDITFADSSDNLIAQMTGFECTISQSLAKAFAANELTQHVES